ncbi:uncharacterized protein LOC113320715 [Papaver somniferum]|uniref:uncharacterized protein LOC113320715 n=1 Tax=Papaver somniferum TaxID=3469 RepID=UPI000E6F820F|nr:uncharacterized protein LOC113320715 [Papaver somniferum]
MGTDTEAPKGDIAVVSSRVKWRIENFSKLSKMHFSDTFSVGCHKWRLLMYPKGAIEGNLSLYLCAVGFSNFPFVEFYLEVINQFDNSYTVRKGAHYKFTALDRARGFTSLMPLNELNGPRKGYIVEDSCIVEAEISMPGVPDYHIPTSLEVHNGNSMEVELSVEALAEVVTPTEDILPVGVMEAVAEVKVSGAAKQDEFPGAGRLYEEGRYCKEVVLDEKYEEVGGFRVLKTQASLYKEIWLNYGHIASTQVLKDLYSSQVAIVTEIMTCIVDMYWYRLEEVSSEMIDTWDKKIQVAEKLEFNISWLRERLEDIKIKFAGEKKLQDTLMEQDQAKSQVLEAEQQLVLANERLNMAKERLFGLETKTSPLLMERQNFLRKCGGRLLLFDGDTSVPLAMAPVEKDATPTEQPIDNSNSETVPLVMAPVEKVATRIEEPTDNSNSETVPLVMAPVEKVATPIEEPIDNSNSETVPCTGIEASIPRRTRTLTTSISPANESKRNSSGDGAGGGNGQHSEKKPKASKDGCAVTLQSISYSPMPSRGSLSPKNMSPANEPKRKSSGDGAGGGNGQHLEKKPKAATSQSISGSPMPSRGSLSPETTSTPNAKQLFTEDEIMTALLQQPIMTTRDLVGKFRSRLNTPEDKLAFSEVMRGICKIQTKENGTRYVMLMK